MSRIGPNDDRRYRLADAQAGARRPDGGKIFHAK